MWDRVPSGGLTIDGAGRIHTISVALLVWRPLRVSKCEQGRCPPRTGQQPGLERTPICGGTEKARSIQGGNEGIQLTEVSMSLLQEPHHARSKESAYCAASSNAIATRRNGSEARTRSLQQMLVFCVPSDNTGIGPILALKHTRSSHIAS